MEAFREQSLMLFSVPVILIAILAEIALTHFRHLRAYTWRETLTNFYLAGLNGSLDLLLRAVVVLPLLVWFVKPKFMAREDLAVGENVDLSKFMAEAGAH